VRSFFLFLVMPMKDDNGRSKPMRFGHHTWIIRLKALMDDILFYGEENVPRDSDFCFRKLWNIFEASFGFKPFVYLKRERNM
jgi:hypothetical protein